MVDKTFVNQPSKNAVMADFPAVSTNTEDYLEAISQLISEKGAARVRDIAAALGVHKSTVSATLKSLAEKGLVNYSRYEMTTLTSLGREIAEDVSRRHKVIGRFLAEILGVDDTAAQANACRMEHILDADVLDRFAWLLDFADDDAENDWLRQFRQYVGQRLEDAKTYNEFAPSRDIGEQEDCRP